MRQKILLAFILLVILGISGYFYFTRVSPMLQARSIEKRIKSKNPSWSGRVEIVKSISSKEGLKGLKVLVVDCKGMTDYSPLSGINFQAVALQNLNNQGNLNFLKNNKSLKSIEIIHADSLTDLSALKGKKIIFALFIVDSPIDISVLLDLPLETLMIQASGISIDYSPIKMMDRLNTISLKGDFSDITFLENKKNLVSVSLRSPYLKDLSPLENSVNITRLSLDTPKVTDISVISNFNDLSSISLSDSSVTDISSIMQFGKIKNFRVRTRKEIRLTPEIERRLSSKSVEQKDGEKINVYNFK